MNANASVCAKAHTIILSTAEQYITRLNNIFGKFFGCFIGHTRNGMVLPCQK